MRCGIEKVISRGEKGKGRRNATLPLFPSPPGDSPPPFFTVSPLLFLRAEEEEEINIQAHGRTPSPPGHTSIECLPPPPAEWGEVGQCKKVFSWSVGGGRERYWHRGVPYELKGRKGCSFPGEFGRRRGRISCVTWWCFPLSMFCLGSEGGLMNFVITGGVGSGEAVVVVRCGRSNGGSASSHSRIRAMLISDGGRRISTISPYRPCEERERAEKSFCGGA